MKISRAHEMRGFLVSITVLVVLLIILVVLVNTIFSLRRIDQAQEREKENVKNSLLDFFADALVEVPKLQTNPDVTSGMNPDIVKAAGKGDMNPVINYLMNILRPVYVTEYAVTVNDGKVVASAVRPGLESFDDFPLSLPDPGSDELQSQVLTGFNGEQGYYISIYSPLNMPGSKGAFFNYVVDRTEQIEKINEIYSDEKSSLIIQQVAIGLVAIAIALVLSLIGVRVLTRRFITGPIEGMTSISHQIMEGAFEGEVTVDEESDFADLQRLLQSGKMLVDRMCEEENPSGS